MILHIFNPEHDIALASDLANFTAPHAGRQLRSDLGWLPALWTADGDAVLVDDISRAERQWNRVAAKVGSRSVWFVEPRMLGSLKMDGISPWGWNKALSAQLSRWGADSRLLPSADVLGTIRNLSHRRTAAGLLPLLQREGTVGQAWECTSAEQVECLLGEHHRLVLKAPWSSSGRGVRFVASLGDHEKGWLRNVLQRQGSVMAEPWYDKVKDFGMEFLASADGSITYCGLSIFSTANGAYSGNLLATEHVKRQLLGRYISLDLLDGVRSDIEHQFHLDGYCGPFGIDMMIVRGTPPSTLHTSHSTLLHPCVEINLRRTMGHAALAIACDDDEVRRVMRIDYNGTNYKLRINKR